MLSCISISLSHLVIANEYSRSAHDKNIYRTVSILPILFCARSNKGQLGFIAALLLRKNKVIIGKLYYKRSLVLFCVLRLLCNVYNTI